MPSRKRSTPHASAGRRRSGRLSSVEQKSSYFEPSEDESEDREAPVKRHKVSPKIKKDVHEGHDDPDDNDNADIADDDDDDDDEAPRRVEIIPLEKLRDTGGVEYANRKVHKNTLLFLAELKANNKRSWLKSHDGEFRRALKDWQSFVEAATETVIDVDGTVPELPVKDVVFRIYRDVRFSKVKTPYKVRTTRVTRDRFPPVGLPIKGC
ncbi:hypothetical protein UVI_02045390 [Ustilaginoidea virens]|uniref:Uncharacterized protein n=1 Tax=Ustilaginoidea virens TaxID=1159556 RepID=A0A1B5KYK6_USTVR|nr:hypothetical protein UVI_02045390 [Ustilaginoidea virens]